MSFFDHGIEPVSPLPPMSLTSYEDTLKFLEAAERECVSAGKGLDPYYDWAIEMLLTSMMSDSASRIFLSRRETGSFELNDLFPFDAVRSTGSMTVDLTKAFVIAPLWNNQYIFSAVEQLREHGFRDDAPPTEPVGLYIRELNLAVLTKDVERIYFARYWGPCKVPLDTLRLEDMAARVKTDGENWLIKEGEQTIEREILEPRMAALYAIALRRNGIEQTE